MEPLAQQNINSAGLGDRVSTASGDFFLDPIPEADVITMGMILHDHNLDRSISPVGHHPMSPANAAAHNS